MIIIAGTVRILEAQRNRAIALAHRMAEATRVEAGCLAYTFSADLSDETLFHVFETWTDSAALDQHFRTPHMADFNRELPTLLADAQLQRFVVASVTPFN